jgi:hypothetical protein
MHGLRCDPRLMGWTRLLDEWVVSLPQYNLASEADSVCWEDRGRTLLTLANAATRVRGFAYGKADRELTNPLDDGTLRFELQGCVYRVAVAQHWPSTAQAMLGSAPDALEEARTQARAAAQQDELAVGVLFVTPRLHAPYSGRRRFEAASGFVAQSRSIPCSGCAFSFPDPGELDRYRYGNDEYPGALLLAQPRE